MSFQSIVGLIGLALLILVVYDFFVQYAKSTGAGWQRVWDAGRGSATIVWQQFGLAIAGLVACAQTVTDWICGLLNAPGADEQIKTLIGHFVTPANVSVAFAIFAVITIWARKRTL